MLKELRCNSFFFLPTFACLPKLELISKLWYPVFYFYVSCRARKERTFLSSLIKKFFGVLVSIPSTGK